MSTSQTTPTLHTGIPAGSLIAVAPPATGKSTLLRAQLGAAGLPSDRTVCRDDIRASLGDNFDEVSPSIPPAARDGFERSVSARIDEVVDGHLAAGRTWFYDQTGCNPVHLTLEVERAHAHGVSAVALRRRDNSGGENVSLDFCLANDARRSRRVPAAAIERMHAAYAALSEEALYDLGFDLVVFWDENSQLPPVAARLPA